MEFTVLVILAVAALFLIFLFSAYIRIISQNEAYVVERLGRYRHTLTSGLHILFPFIDRVAYKHTLKEQVIDVPSQTCITRDNISVEVDGVLYMTVIDPKKASYGVDNCNFAATQIAQTTMRSVIGKLELDRTFEERESINADIIDAVDKASEPWGIKINRYEVRNITPPQSIKDAMERHMRAERDKRAAIATSEGERQAEINRAEGEKLAKMAESIGVPGGPDAVSLRIAEAYLEQFGKLAGSSNTMIIPANVTDIASIVAVGKQVLEKGRC